MAEANFKRQIVLKKKSLTLTLDSIVTVCTIDSVNCSITLLEIAFVNEVYSPAHLTVKATLAPTVQNDTQSGKPSSLPSYQSIVDFFLLAEASVQSAKAKPLESNLYVHEVRPTYVNNGKKVILYLDIFSADKLLTLDKYSKSYVHKSLFGDIISKEVDDFKAGDIKISTQDLSSRLKYKKSPNDTEKTVELIHPYLVQYNEPFYDFLVRTANRMGEFLYFADGKLTLGAKVETDAAKIKTIGNYASFSVDSCKNSVRTTRGISRKYTGTKYAESCNDTTPRYTQPTSNDDYLLSYKKDGFDSWKSEYKPGWRFLPLAFSTWFNTPTIGAFIAKILVDQGKDMVISKLNANAVNDKYNENTFDKALPSTKSADGENVVVTGTYRKSDDYIDDWYVNVNADFYNKIDECEKMMSSRTVTITLNGDDTVNYQVGQIAKVSNISYVITQVKYSEIYDGLNMAYEHVLQVLPLLNVSIENGKHEATLKLTDGLASKPTTGTNIDICCPMPLPEERRVRKASPQTAWVHDNEDPKFLGRVRIYYSWDQPGTASPWLRQAEPAAGHGGGVSFRLYKKDEVMIGYENDNVEQPFVIGALYHGKDEKDNSFGPPTGRNKKAPFTHQLSNRSGHKMVISELKNNASFWAGVQPGVAMVKGWITGLVEENEEGSALAGGFQFSDKYGMYNVQMSSDQRLISIASPMGDIKMSAFSGISITAPRGNISISGKNVSIKAANKLTLESGENAKNTEFKKTWHDENAGWAILDASLQGTLGGISNFITSCVDMSLVRHVVECIIAPVDGTLQIKSNRYLLLEAGLGSAMIPQDGFQDAVAEEKDLGSYNKYYGGSNKTLKMKLHMEKLVGLVDGTAQYLQLLNNVKKAVETYKKERDSHDAEGRFYEDEKDAYEALKNVSNDDKAVIKAMILDDDFIVGNLERSIDIETAGWNLFGAISELKKFVKSYKKKNDHWAWVSYLKDPDFGIAFTKAEDKYRNLFDTVIVVPNDVASIDNAIMDYDNLIRKKYPKSEILFTYLTALRDLGTTSILQQDPKITAVPDSAEEWETFFENLKFHTPEGHTAEKLWGEGNDKFINNLKKNLSNLDFTQTYRENKNWGYDRAKHGRILFSDQGGNTYYVDSKTRTFHADPNPNIGEIKNLVMKIYGDEEIADFYDFEPLL